MQIRVLGCSGGIGGDARTTSFLVDQDILIDAGTGVGDLTTTELEGIDHVFLTHAHLDHTGSLPLLVDSVGPSRDRPVTVHAQPDTLDVLRKHIFNWQIWPDFSEIPDTKNPFLTFSAMSPGAGVTLGDRYIQSIPVNHTVPAVAYLVSGENGSFAFSGDTTVTETLWDVLNQCADLRYLVVETTFLDIERELSELSRHLCPSLLAGELKKLTVNPEIFITHLMPGCEQQIMQEIYQHIGSTRPLPLKRGHVFKL
ncbi:MAG: 3',5'-cyclic-nucleotide phosphodiesterase [Gammaproteobacteria bacterium]|nr:3',5'-cyclic-nucleotide phosphodiesterase [Gammaproteobacteria bacterium]